MITCSTCKHWREMWLCTGRTVMTLPIPLSNGIAMVPFPMDEADFKRLMKTLRLWRKRLTGADREENRATLTGVTQSQLSEK